MLHTTKNKHTKKPLFVNVIICLKFPHCVKSTLKFSIKEDVNKLASSNKN